MSSEFMEGLLSELNEKMGDRTFFTLPELVSLGLFGTVQAAKSALREGKLPYIRISERRCVMPRAALIDYVQNNLSNTKGDEGSKAC